MTERGEQVLRFLEGFLAREGYPPTVREIAAGVGLRSPATVRYHLGLLRAEGRVRWQPGRQRTLTPVEVG